jgi:kynureninase
MGEVAAKAQALCGFFIEAVVARCPALRLVTPRVPTRRGAHICFAHPQGYAVMQALIDRGVIGDFRDPDILRFGFTPLYVGFEDAWCAADILADILETEAWRDPRFQVRARVT